jgi:acyl carrier protein phosphodiesterase
MNYLAHACLSFGEPEILVGNMIADHIKGTNALQSYPQGIAAGVLLHRQIDMFTDNSIHTKDAKKFFTNMYGLYSGAIIDVVYDHFIAVDTAFFEDEQSLMAFSKNSYAVLDAFAAYLPPKFASYFPYMKEHNWLYSYREVQNLGNAFNGLHRRASAMPPAAPAMEILERNYKELELIYKKFIVELTGFVKKTSIK